MTQEQKKRTIVYEFSRYEAEATSTFQQLNSLLPYRVWFRFNNELTTLPDDLRIYGDNCELVVRKRLTAAMPAIDDSDPRIVTTMGVKGTRKKTRPEREVVDVE